jgi:hypothetical protein
MRAEHAAWFAEYTRVCNAAPSEAAMRECVSAQLRDRRDALERSLAEKGTEPSQVIEIDEWRNVVIGTWRDEYSVMTYSSDGTFETKWDTGEARRGRWSVAKGILTTVSGTTKKTSEIISLSHSQLVLKDSGGVWHATRIK